MTCDLVTNQFLELSYKESLLFPHTSTAPMLCFLIFGNNLLAGKYLFPTSGQLVSTSWAISIITLYQINTFSPTGELHVSSSWQMTCDQVPKRFLSSLMRKVCLANINLQLLWYILLPLKITFYQVNTFFPLLGNLFSPHGQSQVLPYTR